MLSRDGRFALTFNGEIYNHPELRDELRARGHSFRSQSDTEVLLHALQEWGQGAVERLSGMYAFGFWDEVERRLLLVRDRLGIKPLYWAENGTDFCFASELTAVLASGIVEPSPRSSLLDSYLRLLWVPDPETMFAGVLKLEPGHSLIWERERLTKRKYWDLPSPVDEPLQDDSQLRETLIAKLQVAVKRQLRADVPVGAFLSGGVDSTSIVSLARSANFGNVRAHSIRFKDSDLGGEGASDDSRYARIAAESFGIPYHEIVLSSDVAGLLPLLVKHLEDPVADPAAINCYLICSAARDTSRVLLSGTGADELFGGYRKYSADSLGTAYGMVPSFLRTQVIEPMASSLPTVAGGRGLRTVRFAKKFLKHAGASPFDRFLGYSTYYDAPELQELLGRDPAVPVDRYVGVRPLKDAWDHREGGGVIDRMTYVDLKYYLPGLGLAYMDKASMAASVEVRVPLIDDDVVDFVARLPDSYKVQGLKTKVILREAMKGRIPDAILRRPKAPFAAPIRTWLRRDLAPMIAEYLSPNRIRARGLLNPAVVRRMLGEHQSGREDHSLRIWALLTLEIWLQEFFDQRSRFAMPHALEEMPLTVAANQT
jgi:asparagine synthase (glutamine-hydrolysing)